MMSDAGFRPPSRAARAPLPALAGLLAALAVLSLMAGAARLGPAALWAGLTFQDDLAALIVWDIRLPRTLLALLVGAMLGLAGAALQGLVRNPLAEPSLFGAPSAAAAAAAFVIAFGFAGATTFTVPVAAIVGALAATAGLVALAGRQATLSATLIAGLAVANLAGALTALSLNLAPNPFAALEIAFWLLGSFEDRSLVHLLLIAPFALVGGALLLVQAPAYRALSLGEDVAASLGVAVERTRVLTVIGVALGVGASVAVCGVIGFVGLVAPHLVRPWVAHDPGRVLVPSALSGAALLLAADIVVRLVPAASELKVGVVTALVGAPVLILLVLRQRRALAGAPA